MKINYTFNTEIIYLNINIYFKIVYNEKHFDVPVQ